jgi:hypothetical protein
LKTFPPENNVCVIFTAFRARVKWLFTSTWRLHRTGLESGAVALFGFFVPFHTFLRRPIRSEFCAFSSVVQVLSRQSVDYGAPFFCVDQVGEAFPGVFARDDFFRQGSGSLAKAAGMQPSRPLWRSCPLFAFLACFRFLSFSRCRAFWRTGQSRAEKKSA